jgi:conjugal transfer ATP-binding protein TraC
MSDPLEALTRLFGSMSQKDGAGTASEMLQQNWDYPSLTAALPYRYSDDDHDLYVNADTTGFILELSPLIGANQQVVASLDDMIRKKLPRNMPFTVMMVASKCVGDRIARGVGADYWTGGMADRLNKITRAFYERASLKGFTNKNDLPLYLRHYRVFFIYSRRGKPSSKSLGELSILRSTLKVSLESAKLSSRNVEVPEFLAMIRELVNYRAGQINPSSSHYSTDELINRQCVDHSIDLEVKPSYLRVSLDRQDSDRGGIGVGDDGRKTASRIVNLQLTKNPGRFALWQTPDNVQNLRFPDMGIPCPFVITCCMEVEDQQASSTEALKKDFDLQKKMASAYGRLFPGTEKAAKEWKRLRQGLSNGEESMCRYFYNVTLFCPDDDAEALKCELATVNTFRKNDLELSPPRYQQMRNYLAMFPFMLQEGLWDDIKMTGASLRATAFNTLNLLPLVAENPMNVSGLLLPTYRNQVAFYDMFSEENGNTNFNMAVTATSGAGKTFFVQGLLRQVLNSGGFAWAIDMGDGYKNFCEQVGGVYLDGAALRFNPFANVTNIKESVSGIVRLITVLASPDDMLDEVCEALLEQGVMRAWDTRQNKARIDDIVLFLKSPAVTEEYADKPTILSRMAELALLLDKYCTWGAKGEYFNSDKPSMDFDNRFTVLEMLSLEDDPDLMSAVLFSLILAIQEKMYHSPRDLKKVAVIDEAWRLLGGSNKHAARFIETGYRTVRRHSGSFVTITQGIKDFTASREAEAAWNNSATKVTLLQDGKAFKSYLQDNPDQFTELEKEVIRKFQKAADTGFSSLLITAGEYSTFHRLFVDPVTRAMFSSRGTDFAFMQEAKKVGATSEEAAYLLAEKLYPQELEELETWYTAA